MHCVHSLRHFAGMLMHAANDDCAMSCLMDHHTFPSPFCSAPFFCSTRPHNPGSVMPSCSRCSRHRHSLRLFSIQRQPRNGYVGHQLLWGGTL